MRRFTITPERRHGDRVTFDHHESHHLARVLRLKAGDTVVAVDGSGRDYTVRLEHVSAESTGTIVGVSARDTESPFPITLVQGLPKGDKMDTLIRAVTELGVARVMPGHHRAHGRAARCRPWRRRGSPGGSASRVRPRSNVAGRDCR